MHNCLYCGEEFDNVSHYQKFCCVECREQYWMKVPQICEACEKTFFKKQPSRLCGSCHKKRYSHSGEPLSIIDIKRAKAKKHNEHCSLDAYLDYADKTPHPIPYGTWIAKKTGKI